MYASNLYNTFTVITAAASTVNGRGRVSGAEEPVTQALKGILSNASERDIERYKQMQHRITHTIVQKGMPIAKQNDVLTLNGRKFYIQDVENPAGITRGPGCFTVYQAEERKE